MTTSAVVILNSCSVSAVNCVLIQVTIPGRIVTYMHARVHTPHPEQYIYTSCIVMCNNISSLTVSTVKPPKVIETELDSRVNEGPVNKKSEKVKPCTEALKVLCLTVRM